MRCLIVLSAVLMVAGCAPTYVQPLESEPSATIVYRTGGDPIVSSLFVTRNEDCEGLTFLAAAGDRNAKVARVRVGDRLFIMTRAFDNVPGGTSFCYNVSSFEPEPGRGYTVMTTVMPGDCRMTVRDDEGNAPEGFVRHDVSKTCQY